jgi:hypothetical protein
MKDLNSVFDPFRSTAGLVHLRESVLRLACHLIAVVNPNASNQREIPLFISGLTLLLVTRLLRALQNFVVTGSCFTVSVYSDNSISDFRTCRGSPST